MENATEILQQTSQKYDFKDFEIENLDSYYKQSLFEVNKENELLDTNTIDSLQNNLDNVDENYTFNPSIDTLYLEDSVDIKELNTIANFIENLSNISATSTAESTNTFVSETINLDQIVEIVHEEEGGSGSSNTINDSNEEQIELLPIYSYNSANTSTSVNNKLDGVFFVGFQASADTCIQFYNTISGWLNNLVMYGACQIKGPFGVIVEALKLGFPVALAAIVSFFTNIWVDFITMLTATGPVGTIAALVIGLYAVACVAALATMFIKGFMKESFAIGWKVYSLIDWEWVFE